uniref:Uncharacterized protein n=1 Tax=Knipowitschia caucasica TaxID=637954 RepID=A0AAV2JW19_KNICA
MLFDARISRVPRFVIGQGSSDTVGKMEAILSVPVPNQRRKVKSFLGLVAGTRNLFLTFQIARLFFMISPKHGPKRRMSALNRAGTLDHGPSESRVVQIYPRPTRDPATYCPLQITHGDTARAVVKNAVLMLGLDSNQSYRLIEIKENEEEENHLDCDDFPLDSVLLWPPKTQKWHSKTNGYYFILQQVPNGKSKSDEYDDLCNLAELTEESITETLRQRFYKLKIYTYTSRILIAINPNKFLPVYYNPKYIKMYENQPLGKLSPHIFAIAAAAYRNMLSSQTDQCIVISGESGSGKTESSSFLVHCLTALSQQTYSSGLERIILGAAPVLEPSSPTLGQ